MKFPLFGDRLLHRFNPMDEKSRNDLTAEFTEKYEKLVQSANNKKRSNEDNKDVVDYVPLKLTIQERIFLFLDNFAVRYCLALLFPLIITFFVRMGQPQEPDNDDDEEDEDYSEGRREKEDIKDLIRKLQKQL